MRDGLRQRVCVHGKCWRYRRVLADKQNSVCAMQLLQVCQVADVLEAERVQARRVSRHPSYAGILIWAVRKIRLTSIAALQHPPLQPGWRRVFYWMEWKGWS